jgi:hypothetical protein
LHWRRRCCRFLNGCRQSLASFLYILFSLTFILIHSLSMHPHFLQPIRFLITFLFAYGCNYPLCSQCLVNPYKPMRTPAEELGLLPDTPSYYIEEKVYRNDTLLYERTIETMHNYGDRRVASYNDDFDQRYFQTFVSLRRIDDSLWVQTSETFYSSGIYADTLSVWMVDGVIHRAANLYGAKNTIYYQYNDKGHLIQKLTVDSNNVETICKYLYSGTILLCMECISTIQDTHLLSIHYSDTLITEIEKTVRKNRKEYFSSDLIRIDTCGNILSTIWTSRLGEEKESQPFGTTTYAYFGDGTYLSKDSSSAIGPAMTTMHFPRKLYPETRDRINGKQAERVRRTIWIY